jgi:hypothetical protein
MRKNKKCLRQICLLIASITLKESRKVFDAGNLFKKQTFDVIQLKIPPAVLCPRKKEIEKSFFFSNDLAITLEISDELLPTW